MYILIKSEYSNGLGYPSFHMFNELETAIDAFNKFKNDAIKELSDPRGGEIDLKCEFIESFWYDDYDVQGTGIFAGVITEEEMTSAIHAIVDESKDEMNFNYIGVDDNTTYTIQVPMCEINNGGISKYYDVDECMVTRIHRRPYDVENQDDDNYIYDVTMTMYYGGYNKCDGKGDEFVESLDQIPYDVFVDLFCYLLLW